MAGLLVLSACSHGSDDKTSSATSTSRAPTSTTAAPDLPPALESDSVILAEVEGVGSVAATTEADAKLPVTATEASAPASLPGALAIADGLAIHVDAAPTDVLEVRLQLPDPPSPDAIPVVIHVRADGTTILEAGLWDEATNEIVVGANTFSDRFGAWWDPRNWIEEVVQVGQGTYDFVADYVSGRTDPPACTDDPPSWAASGAKELSSVHVCLKANPADDGTERVEVYLKSNRHTAQFISVPAGADYRWVQGQPAWLQAFLSAGGMGNPGDTLLLGGQAMSFGYRQPFLDVELETRSYQTQLVGVINQVAGLLGVFEPEDVYAMAALAAECTEDVIGTDVAALDVVPDGFGDLDGFVSAMVTCVIALAQNPDLAISTVDEVLRSAGTSAAERGKVLGSLRGRLDRMAPLAKRLAAALGVAGAAVRAWDGIFDNVAEGLLTLSLDGTDAGATTAPTAGDGNYGPLKIGMTLGQAQATKWIGTEEDNCSDILGGGAEPGEYQYGFAVPGNPAIVGSVDFLNDKISEIRVVANDIEFADGVSIGRPQEGYEITDVLSSSGYDVELTQQFEPADRIDGITPAGATFGLYLGNREIILGVPRLSLCD
ncbi:MAG: hypothetical protein JWM47_1953 [Acidimicrobiales bacterium]|nr:hypothetical protein [Acidimicrobiales bacterium]